MAQRSNPRICLLTPGPFNETYFEQAYLARYLGLLLVEGGDLTMRDGKVHVRTIAGLKRAGCDTGGASTAISPIRSNSTPSLGSACRACRCAARGWGRHRQCAWPGVLEAPAIDEAHAETLPHIACEDLRLPNIRLGGAAGPKRATRSSPAWMSLRSPGAFGKRSGFGLEPAAHRRLLSEEEKSRLAAAMAERGIDYAGQEVVNLSRRLCCTRPARAAALRSARLCGTYAGGMENHAGGSAASPAAPTRAPCRWVRGSMRDVWVLADSRSEMVSPAAHRRDRPHPPHHGHFADRAADNLFCSGVISTARKRPCG